MIMLILALLLFPFELLFLAYCLLIAAPMITGTVIMTVKLCIDITMMMITGTIISNESNPKTALFTVFNSLLLIVRTIMQTGTKDIAPPILSVIILCAGCLYAMSRKKAAVKVLLFLAAEVLAFFSIQVLL